MKPRHVAVIDIGKTNAKLALVDLKNLEEIAVTTRPNTVVAGPPWPHYDVDGHWEFLLQSMHRFHGEYGIDAISVATHGACVALLDKRGNLAAPVLDYEHRGPEEVAEQYDSIRPPFSETGSPRLSAGLNVGAQLHWQFGLDPGLRARIESIVTYPQYWGAKLTGNAATDVTSLGCHSDLWNPQTNNFSTLVETLGIGDLVAPVRKPSDILGTLLPEVAAQTGLAQSTPVHVGIHDSNASLLPYVVGRKPPFSVVSTGTWVIAMSIGGETVDLDPRLDTLINVTAVGRPANSARFMGGREHDVATGGPYPEPTSKDIQKVLSEKIMLMPSVAPECGPYKGCKSHWIGGEPKVGTGARGAAVAFYLALVTAECLSNIGHIGPIIVEGPFAANRAFLQMLAAATDCEVVVSSGTTGTSFGAAMLAGELDCFAPVQNETLKISAEVALALKEYAAIWRAKQSHRAQGHCPVPDRSSLSNMN